MVVKPVPPSNTFTLTTRPPRITGSKTTPSKSMVSPLLYPKPALLTVTLSICPVTEISSVSHRLLSIIPLGVIILPKVLL